MKPAILIVFTAVVGILGGLAIGPWLEWSRAAQNPPTVLPRSKSAPVATSNHIAVAPKTRLDFKHSVWQQEAVDAHATLDEALFDYPSARFKNVYGTVYALGAAPSDFILCGEVNSKNRMGAYSGYKAFAIAYSKDGKLVVDFENDDDSIVYDLCSGRGWAGLQRAQENEALTNRIYAATSPEQVKATSDVVLQQFRDLANGKIKPDPILKHETDGQKDYSREVASDYAPPSTAEIDITATPNFGAIVTEATKQFVKTFRADGASGVVAFQENCYAKADDEALLKCVAFDVAAAMVLPMIERQSHFPPIEQYTDHAFNDRIWLNFAQHGVVSQAKQHVAISRISDPVAQALHKISLASR
jgi:hypothetical protein